MHERGEACVEFFDSLAAIVDSMLRRERFDFTICEPGFAGFVFPDQGM
jgi:hypothetical protein